ncbi:MAG: N(G),N(G)-dimethylarginine dimethylaminohydrolase 1, partial [Paramarteilia canceri]
KNILNRPERHVSLATNQLSFTDSAPLCLIVHHLNTKTVEAVKFDFDSTISPQRFLHNGQSCLNYLMFLEIKFLLIVLRYEKALVKAIPAINGKFDQKLAARTRAAESLREALRYAGVDLFSVTNPMVKETVENVKLNIGDMVFILNGTALMLKPSEYFRDADIIRQLLKNEFLLRIQDIHMENARISGRDILFTGKEIFVGLSGHRTNIDGAKALASTFPEYSVQAIEIPNNSKLGLKAFISVAGNGILSMCESNQSSKKIVEEICLKGKFSYSYLSLPELEAVDSIYLNNFLIHQDKSKIPQSYKIFDEKVEMHGSIDTSTLYQSGSLLSSIYIPLYLQKNLPNFETAITANNLTENLNC